METRWDLCNWLSLRAFPLRKKKSLCRACWVDSSSCAFVSNGSARSTLTPPPTGTCFIPSHVIYDWTWFVNTTDTKLHLPQSINCVPSELCNRKKQSNSSISRAKPISSQWKKRFNSFSGAAWKVVARERATGWRLLFDFIFISIGLEALMRLVTKRIVADIACCSLMKTICRTLILNRFSILPINQIKKIYFDFFSSLHAFKIDSIMPEYWLKSSTITVISGPTTASCSCISSMICSERMR